MIELIIIGHGNFASGILSNVSLITGVPEHCNAIDFSFDISPDMISEKIAEIIESNPDNSGFLIFTDLLNGTPFNVSARLVSTFSASTNNVYCITIPTYIAFNQTLSTILSSQHLSYTALTKAVG